MEFTLQVMVCIYPREVAQHGRAQRSGRWGRRFKSCLPDHLFSTLQKYYCLHLS